MTKRLPSPAESIGRRNIKPCDNNWYATYYWPHRCPNTVRSSTRLMRVPTKNLHESVNASATLCLKHDLAFSYVQETSPRAPTVTGVSSYQLRKGNQPSFSHSPFPIRNEMDPYSRNRLPRSKTDKAYQSPESNFSSCVQD